MVDFVEQTVYAAGDRSNIAQVFKICKECMMRTDKWKLRKNETNVQMIVEMRIGENGRSFAWSEALEIGYD